jgi:hypothetical protein
MYGILKLIRLVNLESAVGSDSWLRPMSFAAKVPLTDVASSGSTILPVHSDVAGCATDEAARRGRTPEAREGAHLTPSEDLLGSGCFTKGECQTVGGERLSTNSAARAFAQSKVGHLERCIPLARGRASRRSHP